jgi:hypothetical protein
MRHERSAHDSFQPLPIGRWAGWTYEEGETKPLRRVRWMPFPTAAGTQKSTSELSGVPEATPEQKRLYETTFRKASTRQRGRGLLTITLADRWMNETFFPVRLRAFVKRRRPTSALRGLP